PVNPGTINRGIGLVTPSGIAGYIGDETVPPFFLFVFQNPLADGGSDPVTFIKDLISEEFTDSVTGSAVAATPLPAALPLFATGLGAMGLIGWRRKRKRLDMAGAAYDWSLGSDQ